MDGNMRRLPPWMLAGASSGVTATSNRSDNKSVEGKRKHEPEATKTKAEKRPRRSVKIEKRDGSEEAKKVGIKRRGEEQVGSKIGEEEAKPPSIGDGKNPEIIRSVTGPEAEDLTVDDLLSFAQEYVKGEEEDQTRKERESLSISESMVVVEESNMTSSQREEPNETGDPTAADMLELILGPFFKTSQQEKKNTDEEDNVRATEFISRLKTANESISARSRFWQLKGPKAPLSQAHQ